jgi:hypothetical protein
MTYYDSKLMPKAPGLGARDVIRESVDAAKPLGMPVIVYTVVQAGGMGHPRASGVENGFGRWQRN